ncbi:MAG: antitoxin [Actinomycetota bacterium]|nr:antitoxin [Actinomycetota bacterium]
MRTTITLDPDARALVEHSMRKRGLTFKQAVNEAIKAGLGGGEAPHQGFTTPRDLGPARVDLTRALSLAGSLEDEEIARRLATGR